MSHKKKTTAQVIHEYGEALTRFYLIALFVVLPLYYQNGYANIANAKYQCYKLMTITFLVLCGVLCLGTETIICKGENFKRKYQTPIILAVVFLMFNLVSFAFSSDHKTAWIGSGSWHMGLLSQILMLVSMLLVYYYLKNGLIIWIAAGVGAGITGLLTVLNRFDIYPLDMGNTYPGFISTLGQTNWATMYVACLMGAGMGIYIFEEKTVNRMVILLVDILIFMGAWVVGSDTVLPVMMIELFVLLGVCLEKREMLQRFAVILSVFGVVTEMVYVLVFTLFHNKFVFVDEGDAVNSLLKRHVGILIILIAAVVFAFIYVTREKSWKNKGLKLIYKVLVALLVFFFVFVILAMIVVTNTPEKAGALSAIRMLRFDYDWGTHRGLNWRCAAFGFIRMNPLRKVIGVGQGGFEGYIYSFSDFSEALGAMYGKYKLMVAHNEYLNLLIENGILGCASYIGFLVSAFYALKRKAAANKTALMALLSLLGYIACSMFFFQHVYATSYMYILIAMALSDIQSEKQH